MAIVDFQAARYTRLAVGYVDAWEDGGDEKAWGFIVEHRLNDKEEEISPYIIHEFQSRGYDMLTDEELLEITDHEDNDT